VAADVTGTAGNKNFPVFHAISRSFAGTVTPTLVQRVKFINTRRLNSDLFRTILCDNLPAPQDV
jgi:hypothetical protein